MVVETKYHHQKHISIETTNCAELDTNMIKGNRKTSIRLNNKAKDIETPGLITQTNQQIA